MPQVNHNNISANVVYVKDADGIYVPYVQQGTKEGASYIADIGVPTTRNNQSVAPGAAINSHPGDDSQAFIWTEADNVRAYRIRVTGGAVGDYIKICEDAVNGVQAAAWLGVSVGTTPTSLDYEKYLTADNATPSQRDNGWSEWNYLSPNPDDLPLTRLDYEASSAATDFVIEVETA